MKKKVIILIITMILLIISIQNTPHFKSKSELLADGKSPPIKAPPLKRDKLSRTDETIKLPDEVLKFPADKETYQHLKDLFIMKYKDRAKPPDYQRVINTLARESQSKSASYLKIPDKFSFNISHMVKFKLKSTASNGVTLPYTRFVIENEEGKMMMYATTDKNGSYQGKVANILNGKLYYRFYGIGITQDRKPLNFN